MKKVLILCVALASVSTIAKPSKFRHRKPRRVDSNMIRVSATSQSKTVALERAESKLQDAIYERQERCPSLAEVSTSTKTMKVGKPGYNRKFIAKKEMTFSCN